MNRSTVAIFEILEKAWATQNCTLVDMKVSTALCWLNWCPSVTTVLMQLLYNSSSLLLDRVWRQCEDSRGGPCRRDRQRFMEAVASWRSKPAEG